MSRLVFVHIPKTGGTAVREALVRATPKSAHVYDYGAGSSVTSVTVKRLRYGPGGSIRALCEHLHGMPEPVFCGHIKAKHFGHYLGLGSFVTVVRDPVEQVVSHYLHDLRAGRFSGSLSEFAVAPRNRNRQTRMVGRTSLQDWLFVARHHCLEQDMARLSDIIGASIELQSANVTPSHLRMDLGRAEREALMRLNDIDARLFSEACGLHGESSAKRARS